MITKLKYLSSWFTKAIVNVTNKTYTFGSLKYAVNPDADIVSVIDTTKAPTFSGSFIVGKVYIITLVGTTDFTLIGATANEVGLTFVATGTGDHMDNGEAIEAANVIAVAHSAIVNM